MEKRISPVVFVSNRHAFRRGEQAADQAQEAKKVAAKLSTAERVTVQRRVEAALMKIIAAAELEFAVKQPERVAQYKALVPAKAKKRKPKPAPQPGL